MTNPDRVPHGEPEIIVVLPRGEALLGLQIPGLAWTRLLGIREDRYGQPLSCAIVDRLFVDLPLHSNPRRKSDA